MVYPLLFICKAKLLTILDDWVDFSWIIIVGKLVHQTTAFLSGEQTHNCVFTRISIFAREYYQERAFLKKGKHIIKVVTSLGCFEFFNPLSPLSQTIRFEHFLY